jgi:[ribosomal protein S18]-alanine N-acetyltransferase
MTHHLLVRAADRNDLASVVQIMASAFDPQFGEAWTASQCEGVLSLPGATLWIAEMEERPVGFALVRAILDEAELLLIAVDRASQRRAIGRRLLMSLTDSAARSGIKLIHLEVRKGNPAVYLYKDVGFIQIGIRTRYYKGADGQLFDAETYQLDLM